MTNAQEFLLSLRPTMAHMGQKPTKHVMAKTAPMIPMPTAMLDVPQFIAAKASAITPAMTRNTRSQFGTFLT